VTKKKLSRSRPKPTTGIDNVLIHNMQLFNRNIDPVQISLLDETAIIEGAYTMHDWWVIVALLFYLDIDEPDGIHRIESTSEVLSLMRYTKTISDASEEAFGRQSGKFDSKYYEAFFESIHRLRSTNVRLTFNRRGEAGYGETTILSYYFYVEANDQVDPYSKKMVDVNQTDTEGQNHVAIYRGVDSEGRPIRYKAFEFSFSPYIVEGLKRDKAGRRIGWTPITQKLMELREPLSKNPGAIKIIFWSLRQRTRPIRRKLDTISIWAGYKDKPGKRRAKTLKALQLLDDLGFLDSLIYDEDDAIVEFDVAQHWQKITEEGADNEGAVT